MMIAEVVFEIGFFNFYVSIAEPEQAFQGAHCHRFGIGLFAKLWLGIEVQ